MRVNYKYDIANASKEKHEKWVKELNKYEGKVGKTR